MKREMWAVVALACAAWGTPARAADAPAVPDIEALREQVRTTEQAFAKTMADRDIDAFATFIAEDAVFAGGSTPLRGRAAIVEGWKPRFQGPAAPFSWAPGKVDVTASGDVALSTGPVFDPEGERIGTFVSTWRRAADGKWLIVLDTGCPACAPPAAGDKQ
jgi:ketosteroid isomerase-like protein